METTLHIDFSRRLGPIRPLHGVNNGPKTYAFHYDHTEDFRRAGIPYARLHDTEYPYGAGHFVDVPCIFKDFSADPDDPASYDFALTDRYIEAIHQAGTKVYYRLGVSIEHAQKKYHIAPPEDYEKWARVCAGIVRHYNECWAEGFRYGIEYWEIWNEPEGPAMWSGTPGDYYRLYEVTANHLKSHFPEIKVGGYAGCGFYALTAKTRDEWHETFIPFFEDFLKYISAPEHRAPLDFYSWHLYSDGDLNAMRVHAAYAREKLNQYGFVQTESILNEWNYMAPEHPFERLASQEAAAFVASMLIAMQRQTDIALSNYYDAQPAMLYCGLFDRTKPLKPYYALVAYNELYKLRFETEAKGDGAVHALAAGDDKSGGILLSNFTDTRQTVTLHIAGLPGVPRASIRRLDARNDLAAYGEITAKDNAITLILNKHDVLYLSVGTVENAEWYKRGEKDDGGPEAL